MYTPPLMMVHERIESTGGYKLVMAKVLATSSCILYHPFTDLKGLKIKCIDNKWLTCSFETNGNSCTLNNNNTFKQKIVLIFIIRQVKGM